jgi:hypothetical protein
VIYSMTLDFAAESFEAAQEIEQKAIGTICHYEGDDPDHECDFLISSLRKVDEETQ